MRACNFPVRFDHMAIYRLAKEKSLSDPDGKLIAIAYELALAELHLKDRTDPVTEIVAARIYDVFRSGERNPSVISKRAIETLGLPAQDHLMPTRPAASVE